MSERDGTRNTGADEAQESFLARWSRRKTDARREPAPTPEPPATAAAAPRESTPLAASAAPAAVTATPPATAAGEPAPVPLPDLATLGEDSDYSAFLTPGVDASLRRLALRQLFASPKFNVFDGLDTYRDDYTSFPALGDVVTADMHHQLERLAAKAAELTEPTDPAREPVAVAAPGTAAQAAAPSTDADPTVADTVAYPQTPPAADHAAGASPPDSTPADTSAAPHEYEHDRSSTS